MGCIAFHSLQDRLFFVIMNKQGGDNMASESDILIIGSGITGCAVARELSRYKVSVTVLEMGNDVAEGATKANSGIVHAGYDAVPGTKKAYYNVRGAAMYPQLCSALNVPFRQNGSFS